jgi:hypothetical protein
MISPATPWTLDIVIFGLELLGPAVAVFLIWFLRNRWRMQAIMTCVPGP